MKISIAAILVFISSIAFSQNTVTFTTKYLPERTYEKNTTTNMSGVMNFSGDTAVINRMKRQGIELPMKFTATNTVGMKSTTGKVKNKSFPVVMEFTTYKTETMMGDKKMPEKENPFADLKVYGRNDMDTTFTLDSIGGTASEEMKNAISQTVNALMNSVKLPNKAYKTGETFEVVTPLAIPIPGVAAFNMNMTTKYTVKKIGKEETIIDYATVLTYDVASNEKQINFTGDGKGAGTMVYSLTHKNIMTNKLTMDVNMLVSTNGVEIDMKMTASSSDLLTIK